MDWLTEHGFVEVQCYVCRESLILPIEKYQKYAAYKHDYCKETRLVNPHWKGQLVLLTGLFSPFILAFPVAIWPAFVKPWAIYIVLWVVTIAVVAIVAVVYDLIYDTGSY